MASNGLAANAKKTIFMILNQSKKECEDELSKSIQVGGVTVPRSSSTKLLGVNIDDQHNWREHFTELQSALNKRTFSKRRISNQIPQKVLKVVQCIWMSKLRYGLQLCNQVRTKLEDPSNSQMNSIQLAQNKMLRMLDRVSLKDHITTKSLLQKYEQKYKLP